MVYWLMSLNKEMGKKLGVFINFKDFKGKHNDALSKMMNDLKKFGTIALPEPPQPVPEDTELGPVTAPPPAE